MKRYLLTGVVVTRGPWCSVDNVDRLILAESDDEAREKARQSHCRQKNLFLEIGLEESKPEYRLEYTYEQNGSGEYAEQYFKASSDSELALAKARELVQEAELNLHCKVVSWSLIRVFQREVSEVLK
jgi:hypothetical protein